MSASLDHATATRAVMEKRPVAEALCAQCAHGILAHSLIGAGTCAGEKPRPWAEQHAGRIPSDCSCDRFRYA